LPGVACTCQSFSFFPFPWMDFKNVPKWCQSLLGLVAKPAFASFISLHRAASWR
jgi:hypothetical protein